MHSILFEAKQKMKKANKFTTELTDCISLQNDSYS